MRRRRERDVVPLGPAALAVAVAIVGSVAGCTATPAGSSGAGIGSLGPASAVPAPPASPGLPTAPASDGTTGSSALDIPPAAALAAEGGDAVLGQLGTYTWGDGGSSSPWLPGAPITVGAGEPLLVTFDPGITPTTWSARLAPPGAAGPAGAAPLADGTGLPTLVAPTAGRYTLALEVVVAGVGSAHYAWALEVR